MKKNSPTANDSPMPTGAELEILGTLWSTGPSTVREVHSALESKGVGYTTVLKQMQMMVAKGLLVRSERFRSHVYEAKARQEEMQQRLTRNLVQQVFGGSAKNLVLDALSAQSVSSEELAEIRNLLDQHERASK